MGELVNVAGEGGGFTPALGPSFLAFFPEGILKGREGGKRESLGRRAGEGRGQGKVLGRWLTAYHASIRTVSPKGPRLAPKEHLCVHTFLAPTRIVCLTRTLTREKEGEDCIAEPSLVSTVVHVCYLV